MRDICIISAISLSFSQCLPPDGPPPSLLDDDIENAKKLA
jgi:hypothetical protein